MAVSREYYSHRVYFRSMNEYNQVRIRAQMLGVGSISNYIRDCVMRDLYQTQVSPPQVVPTPQPIAQPTQPTNPLFPADMKFDMGQSQTSKEKELMEILETKSGAPKTETPEEGYDVEIDPNDPTHMKGETK